MAQTKEKHLIITTYGTDGAAAAAMVLQKYPDASILRTSSTRIGETLLAVAGEPARVVHICGVGPNDTSERIIEGLRRLHAEQCRVIWYCGRGYMEQWKRPMAPYCKTAFLDCASNTGAVFRYLKIRHTTRTRLLLTLGEEYADSTRKREAEHLFWHDLVHTSAAQYFKYEDDGAFIQVIRKLAGQTQLTNLDKKEVNVFRSASSRTVPLGTSPAMKRLRQLIKRLAPIDEAVLILGPSGAGKELVARLLHENSLRAGGPFVPVNCSILSTSSDLAHDRLFGHAAGAYTGAKTSQAGAFETADGGTLLLDEVAELPLSVQTQLLRVLEESTVMPMGTMETRPVNVRIIAATNQDLLAMVKDGRFRLDLYHRLNVLTLRVPALKERGEDMKPIAKAVMLDLKDRGYPLSLSSADWKAINAYDWPGNIRQFINILKRAAFMRLPVVEVLAEEARGNHGNDPANKLDQEALDALRMFYPASAGKALPEAEVRRAYMQRVFALCGNNWAQTARQLRVAPNTLRKWLEPAGQ